jgi:lysophospholipase L1-like esterase
VPLRLAKISALGAMLLALALALATSAGAATPRYYLSLGDSLAQGMQPEADGITVNTNRGYADQLYAIEKPKIAGLKLVKLGCGGESTTSFLTGHGNTADSILLGCKPAGGSQMSAAERFLRSHRRRGEVAFLTLDIGANDIDGCAPGGTLDVSCVQAGAEKIASNLPVILRRLRRAAAPGTPMAAMTLYDPFLALYLTAGGRGEAISTVRYARNLNEALAQLYRNGKFRVANVDTAFRSYDLSSTSSLAGYPGRVPVAVADVCRLTWMCAAPPRGPNIHANDAGYGLIARTFASALRPLG